MRKLFLTLICLFCTQPIVLAAHAHADENRFQHRERRIQEAEARGDITPQEAAALRDKHRKEQGKGEGAEAEKSTADSAKSGRAPADP